MKRIDRKIDEKELVEWAQNNYPLLLDNVGNFTNETCKDFEKKNNCKLYLYNAETYIHYIEN